MDVSGGTIDITANDDGLNAADGSDSTYTDPFGGGNDSCVITISGGVLNIDAGGDGLDSNGSLYVTGGEVYVSGSTGDGDSALDYNGSASGTVPTPGASSSPPAGFLLPAGSFFAENRGGT